jgi:CARDB
MNIKRIVPRLVGGLLAAAFVVTALAGTTRPAAADLNSELCNPCHPDTRPDLKPASFDASLSQGALMVPAAITNAGHSSAGPSTYNLLVNGQSMAGGGIGSLAPGATESLGAFGFLLPCPATGKFIVQLVVDSGNTVNESNEANNTAQKTVHC